MVARAFDANGRIAADLPSEDITRKRAAAGHGSKLSRTARFLNFTKVYGAFSGHVT